MELNKKAMVKLALMVFLLGFTATVDARFDRESFIKQSLQYVDVVILEKHVTQLAKVAFAHYLFLHSVVALMQLIFAMINVTTDPKVDLIIKFK
ncbi:trypsin inhibitor [Trifolium pratense]|uniref:Trypsin inhibitor n=1 Tax=Trifolium pratense TaxID=57577 RepID=A0A2K3JLZ7_TRIPR|nr:trypsin inhibitor [Trifolium pratense]